MANAVPTIVLPAQTAPSASGLVQDGLSPGRAAPSESNSRHAGHNVQPYRMICERTKQLEKPKRHHVLETIGVAPVNTPARPSRLALIKTARPSSTPATTTQIGVNSQAQRSANPEAPATSKPTTTANNAAGAIGSNNNNKDKDNTASNSNNKEDDDENGGNSSSADAEENEEIDRPDSGLDGRSTVYPNHKRRPSLGEDEDYASARFRDSCRALATDQQLVEAYDAHHIYLSSSLFKHCSLCFIRHLVAHGGPDAWSGKSFQVGAEIYSEGSWGLSGFVVARGLVEAKKSPTGPTTRTATGRLIPALPTIRVLGPGDCFGVEELLGLDTTRKETVRAKTSLHVLEVSGKVLTKLLVHKSDPNIDLDDLALPTWDRKALMAFELKRAVGTPRFRAKSIALGAEVGVRLEEVQEGADEHYTFIEERHYFERIASQLSRSAAAAAAAKLNTSNNSSTINSNSNSLILSSNTILNNTLGGRSNNNSASATNILGGTQPTSRSRSPPSSPLVGANAVHPNSHSPGKGHDDIGRREKYAVCLREVLREDIRKGYMVAGDAADLIRSETRSERLLAVSTNSRSDPSRTGTLGSRTVTFGSPNVGGKAPSKTATRYYSQDTEDSDWRQSQGQDDDDDEDEDHAAAGRQVHVGDELPVGLAGVLSQGAFQLGQSSGQLGATAGSSSNANLAGSMGASLSVSFQCDQLHNKEGPAGRDEAPNKGKPDHSDHPPRTPDIHHSHRSPYHHHHHRHHHHHHHHHHHRGQANIAINTDNLDDDNSNNSPGNGRMETEQALVLELLPPLHFASPCQKQVMLKDLEKQAAQARQRRRYLTKRHASFAAATMASQRRMSISSARNLGGSAGEGSMSATWGGSQSFRGPSRGGAGAQNQGRRPSVVSHRHSLGSEVASPKASRRPSLAGFRVNAESPTGTPKASRRPSIASFRHTSESPTGFSRRPSLATYLNAGESPMIA